MENIYKGFNKGSIKSHYLLVTDFLYDLFLSKKHSTPRHILLVLYDEVSSLQFFNYSNAKVQ